MIEKYNIDVFQRDLSSLNISLSNYQMEQFLMYYEMLVEKNKVMNLTAITDYDEVMKKHFIDSLSLIHVFDCTQSVRVLDLGTGAGFPGIPLKIAFPNLKITLLDSLNKRVKFLNEVIDALQLTDIEAIHGRAEDFSRDANYREKFDLCVSRAVANMSTLSEYCLPFVRVGGVFIPYKSEKLVEELENAKHAVSLLGGELKEQMEFVLPNSNLLRSFVKISKIRVTNQKYPRKAGLPSKEPLVKNCRLT